MEVSYQNIFQKHSRRIFIGTILVLLAANIFTWYVIFSENRGEVLTVAFLDIGQGDSIFIEAPNGNQIIFDGGPNGKILSELGKLMPFYDRKIDMIVVTNPDQDHFAGFIDLLSRYKIEKFMEPGTKSGASSYRDLEKAVGDQKAEKIIAKRGMKIELDREHSIYIEILFPDSDVSKEKTNEGSIVARLTYGDTSFMLTGDSIKKTEDYLVELDIKEDGVEDDLKSDVLKIGHHGSKTSTGENFIEKVAPKYAVISNGKNNRYGHPNVETLDTLEKFNVKILRTDQSGTIVMKSDGRFIDLVQ